MIGNSRMWLKFAFRLMHVMGVVAIGGYYLTKAFFFPDAEVSIYKREPNWFQNLHCFVCQSVGDRRICQYLFASRFP